MSLDELTNALLDDFVQNLEDLPFIIKELRVKHNLTLQDVAHYQGIQKSTISYYENGKRKHIPTEYIKNLIKMIRELYNE